MSDSRLLVKSACYGVLWYFWVATLILPAYGNFFSASPLLTHGLLLVACVVVVAAYGALSAMGRRLPANRWPLILAITLLSLSVAFNVAGLGQVLAVHEAFLLLICMGFGVGLGLFACVWIEFLGTLSVEELKLSMLTSVGVGTALLVPAQVLCGYDLLAFSVVEIVVSYLAVPFLQSGMGRAEQQGQAAQQDQAAQQGQPAQRGQAAQRGQKPCPFLESIGSSGVVRALLRVLPSLACFGLFLGFFVSNLPGGRSSLVTTSVLAAIVLVVVLRTWRLACDGSFVARLVFAAKLVSLLGIVGVVLFLVYPSISSVWLGVVAAGFVAYLLAVMLLCSAALSKGDGIDRRPALAGILSVSTIGVVAGLLIRLAFGGGLDGYFKLACLLIVSVLAAVATLLLDVKVLDAEKPAADVAALVFSDDGDFAGGEVRAYCATIAEEYGLTAKQAEVLVYLSFGRTAKSIAKSLGNSEGTIRGHINHVYAKLGVHSKDELEVFLRNQFAQRRP